jgi:ubiquitin-like protein Pup
MGISYATVDQQKKVVKPTEPQKEKEERSGGKVTEKGKEIKKNLEDLMDQIDEVLEQNAEEFVKNFTQRGGE